MPGSGAIAFMKDLNDETTIKVTSALEDNTATVDFASENRLVQCQLVKL